MPPPGRRRPDAPATRLLPLLFAVLLFLCPSALAANAVLGLDLGTEYLKAALVKPGIPLEIVLTKDSKRKETSAIAFKPLPGGTGEKEYPDRLYGGDAMGLAPRFPSDVYPNLKHLLGLSAPVRDDSIAQYRRRFPGLDLQDHAHNGSIVFRSKSFGAGMEGVGSFSVEELLSMELKGIRQNAENMAGGEVRNTVITIPNFYTADEKRAVEFAAELAGFRVMGLISDGLAVGLNYATSRTFGIIEQGNTPEYHLVYDMGAGSTTATLLRMQGRRIKDTGKSNKTAQEVTVMGVGWDRTLGGDAMNDLIVDNMVKTFTETSGAKAAGINEAAVRQHGRTMAKFWREAERLRQVLSANTATSGFFESLMEDVDFRYKLSRTEFEEMTAGIAARVGQPLEDALSAAKIDMNNLTSVILHGGSVRTPFIQTSLEARVGDPAKLRGNVNADEAAVFGAAFKAAGLSPSFKVKEIRSNDVAAYNTAVHWTSNGKQRTQQVFIPTSQVGPVKQMPFKFLDDFTFTMSQKVPNAAGGDTVDRPIIEFNTVNLTASVGELITKYNCARENISTTVYLHLEPTSGLPGVRKGTVSCESSVEEKKAGGVMDGVKGMFGFGKKDPKSAGADDDIEELEPLPEVSSETSSTSSSTTTSKSVSSSSSSSKSKDQKATPTPKVQVINVGISHKKIGLPEPPESELRRMKDGLAAFDRSDQGRRLREELFNGLEGFTYKVRDLLTDESFKNASKEAERTNIESVLGMTSEWLHGEGASAGMDPIKEKLQELKALVDPINKRRDEASKRPAAVQKATNMLEKTEKLIEKIKKEVQKAASSVSSSISTPSAEASSEAATPAPSAEEASASAPPAAEGEAQEAKEGEATGDSTSTPETTKTTTAPPFKFTAYDPYSVSQDDVDRLQKAYDSAADWLLENLEKQEALGENDDPVLLEDDVDKVTSQLRSLTEEIDRKQKAKAASISSASSSSSASKSRSISSSKSKASAAAKSASEAAAKAASGDAAEASPSATDAEASQADATSTPAPEESAGSEADTKPHDEL